MSTEGDDKSKNIQNIEPQDGRRNEGCDGRRDEGCDGHVSGRVDKSSNTDLRSCSNGWFLIPGELSYAREHGVKLSRWQKNDLLIIRLTFN